MAFFEQSSTTNKSLVLITTPPTASTLAVGGLTPNPLVTKAFKSFNETEAATRAAVEPVVTKTPAELINEAKSKVTGFISKQLSSVTSVFDKNVKSLAGSVSKELASVFGDTNKKAASTATTKTSDPVTTLLKTPLSKTFKLDTMQSGSGSVGGTGSVSQNGTLADAMVGTKLSTLLDRFSLDSKEALGSVLGTQSYQDKLSGLFTDVKVVVEDPLTIAKGGIAGLQVDTKDPIFSVVDAKLDFDEIKQDIGDFKNTVGSFGSSLLSDQTDFSFYTQNLTPQIVNEKGEIVSTSKSVSASSANSILGLIKKAGCSLTNGEYNSVFEQQSLFNLSILGAAAKGMLQEVKDLVHCSQADTSWGQDALKSVLAQTAGSDLEMSAAVSPAIKDLSTLNIASLSTLLFTNPNLTKADSTTMTEVLTTLKSSPAQVLEIPQASSPSYPVWDLAILEDTQPQFMNAILETSDMDIFANGTLLTLSPTGQFA